MAKKNQSQRLRDAEKNLAEILDRVSKHTHPMKMGQPSGKTEWRGSAIESRREPVVTRGGFHDVLKKVARPVEGQADAE